MKSKKLFKYLLYWLLLGLIASTMGHLAIEVLQRIGFTSMWPSAQLFLIGTGILFILYTFLSALFKSPTLGGIMLTISALIIGIINRVKIQYRADPLFPSDFLIAKEVPFLVEMVGWLYAVLIVITVIGLIYVTVKFYQKILKPRKPNLSRKVEWPLQILGVFVSGTALFYVTQFHQPNHLLREYYSQHTTWAFEHQLDDFQTNGFVAGFLANLPGEPMDKPSGYSREKIEAIVHKYQKQADAVNRVKGEASTDTNILFVMNESFSDPFNLEGIESNQDPLTHFRRIANETFSGQVLSPTFGGGTNANEFQALTGFSLEPMNPQITSPYVQLVDGIKHYPTIVDKLNELNYQTTAIHPYDKSFFERNEVYEKMGFDDFFHEENMKYTERITEDHLFISDESAYKEAFEVLNHSKKPDFIHIVTMQNHTPYADKYDETNYEVTGSGNAKEANAYFQDLENSDKALKDLITQINQHPEPILLLFWGDHLPGLYRGDIRQNNEAFTLRQTPFFAYSNQQVLQGEIDTTSPIYFNNWVYNWLDIPLTPYDALLVELEKALPMLDNGLYIEHEKFLTSRDELSRETLEILKEYEMILYDVTTGERYAHELQFFTN